MAWYNIFGENKPVEGEEEKLNPAQAYFGFNVDASREQTLSYEQSYEKLEVVNRAVNMIVDDVAEISAKVGGQLVTKGIIPGTKQSKVHKLINIAPNPYQDINTFKRNLITDFLLDGNIFIYYDGSSLYHLPANKVAIHSSAKTYIEKYTFNETVDYKPSEIIHIKENSFYSIYRGVPRLKPALRTMNIMQSMRNFQDNFFKNGAVPGLVLKSPNTLSEKIKERMMASWGAKYNPNTGGRNPLILDGGLEIDEISNVNFKDLDFQNAIAENEKIILKALGVPPIMLDSGNNANLKPNMRMYYLETVLPIVRKVNFALERYFGFEIREDASNIPALQPELSELAGYNSTLVNGGIITPNEARINLGLEPIEDEFSDNIRVPANVAGSAVDPNVGGRPEEGDDD